MAGCIAAGSLLEVASCRDSLPSVTPIFAVAGVFVGTLNGENAMIVKVPPNFFLDMLDSAACQRGLNPASSQAGRRHVVWRAGGRAPAACKLACVSVASARL